VPTAEAESDPWATNEACEARIIWTDKSPHDANQNQCYSDIAKPRVQPYRLIDKPRDDGHGCQQSMTRSNERVPNFYFCRLHRFASRHGQRPREGVHSISVWPPRAVAYQPVVILLTSAYCLWKCNRCSFRGVGNGNGSKSCHRNRNLV
jgi:hypothetical protein